MKIVKQILLLFGMSVTEKFFHTSSLILSTIFTSICKYFPSLLEAIHIVIDALVIVELL